MLVFTSGVFKGWRHETFGQCSLDSVWLIPEELPQSGLEPGGHWKHLFRPVVDVTPPELKVEGTARLGFFRPDVFVSETATSVVVETVSGTAAVAKVVPQIIRVVSLRRTEAFGRAGRVRPRCSGTVYVRGLSGAGAVRGHYTTGCTTPAYRAAGFGVVSGVRVSAIQNPTEAMLALLL